MEVVCAVEVSNRTTKIGVIKSSSFEFEYHTDLFTVNSGDKLQINLTPFKDKELYNQSEYIMCGKEIETAPITKNVKCISFGGLIGRFSIKDPTVQNQWYLYIKRIFD